MCGIKEFMNQKLHTYTKVMRGLILILIYGSISIISVHNIIFSKGYIGFFHDWGLPVFPEQWREYLGQTFSSWSTSNLGVEQDFGMWILRRSLLGLLYMLGFEEGDVAKIFLFFVITLSGLSMYYLCRKVQLSFPSSMVAGVFYSTTPILFTRIVAGHLDHMLSYALSPMAIAFFIKALESKKSSAIDFMTAGLFYTLASIQIQYFVLLFLVFLAYSTFSIVSKQQSFTKCATALLGVIIIPLLAYLPGYILTWNIWRALGDVRATPTKSPSLMEAFKLTGYVSPYFEESIKECPFSGIWQIFSSLIPLLAFSTILLESKDKRTVFWSVFGILSLFIAKGANPPFGDIFLWAFKNLQVMRMFSEVYHLMILVAWSYSILLGILLDSLALKFKMHLRLKCQNSEYAFDAAKLMHSFKKESVIALFVLILICLYSFPFYTGDFGGNIKSYKLDKKYQQVLDVLSEDPDDYRILWLPLCQPMSYNGTGHGIDPIIALSPKPSIGNYLPWNSPSIKYILFLISTLHENRTNRLGTLLGLANIKYVIHRSDFETKLYNYLPMYRYPQVYGLYQNENEIFKNLLLQQKDFILKNATGPMLMFENKHYLPHLYATDDASVVAGDLGAFVTLSYLDSNDIKNQKTLFFASQLSANDSRKVLNECGSVIIQDDDFLDLVFSLFPDEYKLDLTSAVTCSDATRGWTSWTNWWWYNWHYSSALESWVITQVSDTLSIPFRISEAGAYDLWMKVYCSPRGSLLSIKVDNSTVGFVITKASNEVGFRWIHIKLDSLDPGEHKIAFTSNDGENVIARLVIAPREMYAEAQEVLDQLLAGKEIILLSEAEKFDVEFDASLLSLKVNTENTSQWVKLSPLNESVLKIEVKGHSHYNITEIPSLLSFENISPLPSILNVNANNHIYFEGENSTTYEVTFRIIGQASVGWKDDAFNTSDWTLSTWWKYPQSKIVTSNGDILTMYMQHSDTPGFEGIHLVRDISKVNTGIYRYLVLRYKIEEGTGSGEFFVQIRDPSGAYRNVVRICPLKNTSDWITSVIDLQSFGLPEVSKIILALDDNATKGHNKILIDYLAFLSDSSFSLKANINASQGLAVKLEQFCLKKEFYVPRDGNYEISFRLLTEVGYPSIKAIIANYTFQTNLPEKGEFFWVKLGTVHLNSGTYTLRVEASGGIVFLDSILIRSTDRDSRMENSSIEILTCQKLSETNFKLSITARKPFFLVFSEAFNPSWLVYVNGTLITPIIVNSYANAYYIDAIGYLSINIIFAKQQQYVIIGSLTFLTILMSTCLIVLVAFYRKLNKKQHT
jgi:hypothetical protein